MALTQVAGGMIASGQTITSPTITGGTWTSPSGSTITSGTSQASTSGTSIDFTGIPSWVKRITVMFNGMSGSGSSSHLIQIGDGTINTTGYVSSATSAGGTNQTSTATSTSGYVIDNGPVAANTRSGAIVITALGGNIWISSGILTESSTWGYMSAGTKTLAGTLDRIRITTVNGTDTFDAGSINILYE